MNIDRAIWISWYDLADDGRKGYLDWVGNTYMPTMLQRPGLVWGAHYASEERANVVPQGGGQGRVERHAPGGVPDGYRYILMFGASDPYAFVTPTPARFHAALPEDDQVMLRLRRGERSNIMLEEA